MSVLRDVASGLRKFRLVVLLNNSMDTASGERRASVLVDKATVHGLARAGTQVLYVGRAPEMEALGVPVDGEPIDSGEELGELEIAGAGSRIVVHRWYHWPWSVPREIDLEQSARSVVDALSRAFPEQRFVAIHRFDPSVVKKVATSRRVKLGTVEVRRSFDAAPGRILDMEVDGNAMHRAEFVGSDATFAIAVHALPFSQKVALLESAPVESGARVSAGTDRCGDVFVSAVLFDLVREQRALGREGWRAGANAAQLAKWMPMLSELTAAFSDPVDLSTPRGQRFVELVAWLDLVARGHDRWFEWVPPFMWLRRGMMLRGVVRSALGELVEKACADRKAAWTAIATRRRELGRKAEDAYERPLDFTVGRLKDALSARSVICDAEAVAPTRVLTGAEHDDLAKKEGARVERAQAVVSRAAEARAELLVKDGWDGLTSHLQAEVRVEAQVDHNVEEREDLATAGDLAALREVP
jgi:hypothetical protein